MKIILAGCTGYIGKPLLYALKKAGHQIVMLTRSPDKARHLSSTTVSLYAWDGKSVGDWMWQINGADAVINLSGESIVAKRWNERQKEVLMQSRIESTKTLVEAMRRVQKKPEVFINASAAGYYGSVESGEVTESHKRGEGFLADLCEAWEKQAREAESLGVRSVIVRIGIVLEKGGGAMDKMVPPFQMFMGGPLGNGKQWFPWVHRDDIVGALLFALQNKNISGPVNATAPAPVTMNEFCKELGKVMHRPSWMPVPAFALRILLGEMSELLLTGQKVVPKRLQEAGYEFSYPDLNKALTSILHKLS